MFYRAMLESIRQYARATWGPEVVVRDAVPLGKVEWVVSLRFKGQKTWRRVRVPTTEILRRTSNDPERDPLRRRARRAAIGLSEYTRRAARGKPYPSNRSRTSDDYWEAMFRKNKTDYLFSELRYRLRERGSRVFPRNPSELGSGFEVWAGETRLRSHPTVYVLYVFDEDDRPAFKGFYKTERRAIAKGRAYSDPILAQKLLEKLGGHDELVIDPAEIGDVFGFTERDPRRRARRRTRLVRRR